MIPAPLQKVIRWAVISLTLLALLGAGSVATETRLFFYWPCAGLLALAGGLALLHGRWRMESAPSSACVGAMLLFAAYVAVRDLTSPVVADAHEDLFLILGCTLMYLLSATVLQMPSWRLALAVGLMLLTWGNLAAGAVQLSGNWTFHIVPGYMRAFGGSHRIGGFFNNPNHLGSFLATSALVMAALLFFGRLGRMLKGLLGLTVIGAVAGVALAVSRGALLSLGVGALVLTVGSLAVIRGARPRWFGNALRAAAMLAVLSSTIFYSVFAERLESRFTDNTGWEMDARHSNWEAALAEHAENPWFGRGGRRFYTECITHRSPAAGPEVKDAVFAHNEYLQVFADYGWIGLVLALLALLAHFWNGCRYLRNRSREAAGGFGPLLENDLALVLGALAGIAALAAHAALEFQLHVPAVAWPASFLLGILANPGPIRATPPAGSFRFLRPVMKLALAGCGLWTLWGVRTEGRAASYEEEAMRSETATDYGLHRIGKLNQALDWDPQNYRLWMERGAARREAAASEVGPLGVASLQTAIVNLEQARVLNPYDMFIALALADAGDAAGQSGRAEQALQDALRLAPLHMEPRLNLALHYHRQGRFHEAEEAYLWARDAPAGKSADWTDLYQQLLRDAAAKK